MSEKIECIGLDHIQPMCMFTGGWIMGHVAGTLGLRVARDGHRPLPAGRLLGILLDKEQTL